MIFMGYQAKHGLLTLSGSGMPPFSKCSKAIVSDFLVRGRPAPVTVLAALPAFAGTTELVVAAFRGCHPKEGKQCLKEESVARPVLSRKGAGTFLLPFTALSVNHCGSSRLPLSKSGITDRSFPLAQKWLSRLSCEGAQHL